MAGLAASVIGIINIAIAIDFQPFQTLSLHDYKAAMQGTILLGLNLALCFGNK
jgi:hypothetical protein